MTTVALKVSNVGDIRNRIKLAATYEKKTMIEWVTETIMVRLEKGEKEETEITKDLIHNLLEKDIYAP